MERNHERQESTGRALAALNLNANHENNSEFKRSFVQSPTRVSGATSKRSRFEQDTDVIMSDPVEVTSNELNHEHESEYIMFEFEEAESELVRAMVHQNWPFQLIWENQVPYLEVTLPTSENHVAIYQGTIQNVIGTDAFYRMANDPSEPTLQFQGCGQRRIFFKRIQIINTSLEEVENIANSIIHSISEQLQ